MIHLPIFHQHILVVSPAAIRLPTLIPSYPLVRHQMSSSKSEPQAVHRVLYPKALDTFPAAKWIDVAVQGSLMPSREQSTSFVTALLRPAKAYEAEPPSSWLTPAKLHHGLYLSVLGGSTRCNPPAGYRVISSLGPTLAPIPPPYQAHCPIFSIYLITRSLPDHAKRMYSQIAQFIARIFVPGPPSRVRCGRTSGRISLLACRISGGEGEFEPLD